jgi:hypothetical protein
VRVRLELPANRWLLLQQVFTRASAARPTMRKRSALQRAAPYQSVLFERGFGYLSDGGVSIGHRDPRLRM